MFTAQISPKLTIASQPRLDDFADLARAGFTAVINNRPDGEEPAQPRSAEEEAAAAAAGMGYRHIPVTGPTLTEAAVRSFQAALAEAPGPVFAHCRSGTRTLTLWAIGEVLDGRMALDDVVPLGQSVGIDLRGVEAFLSTRR